MKIIIDHKSNGIHAYLEIIKILDPKTEDAKAIAYIIKAIDDYNDDQASNA